MNAPVPRLIIGMLHERRGRPPFDKTAYLRSTNGGCAVKAHPETAMEWALYWRWSGKHYNGIRSHCAWRKHRQAHAFTHMGMEEA